MKIRTLSLFVVLVMAAASCGGSDPVSTSAAGDGTDQSDDLADAQENLEELLESDVFGSATGIVNVLGVEYIFDTGTCFADATSFDASGPGQTADGVPFWASVSSSIETRQGMEEAGLPQANIDAFFGDKDSLQTLSVEVELGKSDRFSSGEDGMADFSLDLFDASNSDQASFRIEGNRLSGSGQISDWNGVLIPFGETAAVDFTSSCN